MQKFLWFTTVIVLTQASYAQSRCASLFMETQPAAPHTTTKKGEVRLAPIAHLEHETRERGHIRLQELVRNGEIVSHKTLTERLIKTISHDRTIDSLGPKDSLLVLDVLGDKGGFIRNVIEGMIQSKALDFVGFEAQTISYRVESDAQGKPRLVVILREDARDYRTLKRGESSLTTHHEMSRWLGREIENLGPLLYPRNIYRISEVEGLSDQIFEMMRNRPGDAKSYLRPQLTRDEFTRAFNRAYPTFLASLNGQNLLYVRSNFWGSDLRPSENTLNLFHYYLQRGPISLDQFIKGYGRTVLAFRDRLYRAIHNSSSEGRGSDSGIAAGGESGFRSSVEREGDSWIIKGATAQVRYGEDFHTGVTNRKYTLLDDIAIISDLEPIVKKLKKSGFTDLAGLHGYQADKLLTGFPALSFVELRKLALELADHSTYMYYSAPLLLKFDRPTRVLVRHPTNRTFTFNPRRQQYELKEQEEMQPQKERR